MKYGYTIDQSALYGPIVTLRGGTIDDRENRIACVAPQLGCNLFRFVVDGMDILQYDESHIAATGFLGNPILYPTPNRVRDGCFAFEGVAYPQAKGGRSRLMHGLLYDEAWRFDKPEILDDGVRMRTFYVFERGNDCFASFPFPHCLSLTYTLGERGVSIDYCVENQSDRRLPFGFGMHPFFSKLAGENGTHICVPAARVYERDAFCMPSGKRLDVAGTRYDLQCPVAVGALRLDDVYTDFSRRSARIFYRGLDFFLELRFSKDFSHMVVFTPEGKRFFCLENQTCCTDAHNLYDRTGAAHTGLRIAAPRQRLFGTAEFLVRSCALASESAENVGIRLQQHR